MKIRFIAMFALPLALGACASVAPVYTTSARTQATLAALPAAQVGVAAFTQPEDIVTMCRGNGPVEPPGHESFAVFVHNAFVDELQHAGKFASANPKVTLHGALTKVEFSSSHDLIKGYWDLGLQLRSDNGKQLKVAEHYDFDSGILAVTACDNSAEALPKAVRALIQKTVESPGFAGLLAAH